MEQNDFITKSSISIITESGYHSLKVSEEGNRLIIRYLKEYHEKMTHEEIIDLFCYNDDRIVKIFVLMQNSFEEFDFNTDENEFILEFTINEHFDKAVLIDPPFIRLDNKYYNIEEEKYVSFEHNYDSISKIYAVCNESRCFLFKRNKVIQVYEKALLAVVKEVNEQFELFCVRFVQQEVWHASEALRKEEFYAVQTHGLFEYELNLTDIGDAVPEMLRVNHIMSLPDAIIYQIVICLVVSEKCRLFSIYMIQNTTVLKHYLELHTNVRISRIFSNLTKNNIVAVNHELFVVEELRKCKEVIAFPDRIDTVCFARNNYVISCGPRCVLLNENGNSVKTLEVPPGEKNIQYYNKNIYIEIATTLKQYDTNLVYQNSVEISNLYQAIIYDDQVLLFIIEKGCIALKICLLNQLFDEMHVTLLETFYTFAIPKSINYVEQLSMIILYEKTYVNFVYLPLIAQKLFPSMSLPEGVMMLDDDLQLTYLERTKFGNMEVSPIKHSSKILKYIDIELRIWPTYSEKIDVQSEFDELFDEFSINIENVHFLSLNEYNFIKSETKFNKYDFPEWLHMYYQEFSGDSATIINIPTVTNEILLNSDILFVSPLYHLEELFLRSAQAEFKLNKDPNEVALFFILANKIPLLSNLYRTESLTKIADYLLKDFSLEKNQQSATKNAFILLSKHEFEEAIAWFLLGHNYYDAIKIAFDENYLNSPILAVRIFEMYRLKGDITEEFEEQYYNFFSQGINIENSTIAYYLDSFFVDEFLKRQIMQKSINYDRIAFKILEILQQNVLSQDLDKLCNFFICANIYYENELVSKAIFTCIVAMMLKFDSVCLRKIYLVFCQQYGVEANEILMHKLKKLKEQKLVSPSDVNIDKIAEINNLKLDNIKGYKRIVCAVLYLHICQPEFKEYKNVEFIKYFLLRHFHCQIYEYRQQTNLSLKDLFVLFFIMYIYNEIEDLQEYTLNPLERIADIYSKFMKDSKEQAEVGNFNELLKYVQDTWLPREENVFFHEMLQDIDQEDEKLLVLVIEEAMFYWLENIKNEGMRESAWQFLGENLMEETECEFNINEQQFYKVESILIFEVSPLLILVLNDEELHIFQYNSKISKFEEEHIISCADMLIINKKLFVFFKEEVTQYFFSQEKKQFLELGEKEPNTSASSSTAGKYSSVIIPLLCPTNSKVRFEKEGHFFIALNNFMIELTFLSVNQDTTYRAAYEFGQIVDFAINEMTVIIVVANLKRESILELNLGDIISGLIEPEVLSEEYQKITRFQLFAMDKERYCLLISSSKLIVTTLEMDKEMINVDIGNVNNGFILEQPEFCCSDVAFCIEGKENLNICLGCGREWSGDEAIIQYDLRTRVIIKWEK